MLRLLEQVDDAVIRRIGFISMLAGLGLLLLVR